MVGEENMSVEEPLYEPEVCEDCGCPAGDFGDEDYHGGVWSCPECGQVQ